MPDFGTAGVGSIKQSGGGALWPRFSKSRFFPKSSLPNALSAGVGPFRDGKTFATINPATEETIAEVAAGTPDDVDAPCRPPARPSKRALGRGWAPAIGAGFFSAWPISSIHMADDLAALESLDNGKPIRPRKASTCRPTAETFRYFAGYADKVYGQTIPIPGDYFTYTRREPVGVAGQIIPWNFPC